MRGGTFYSFDSEEETTAFILSVSVMIVMTVNEVSFGVWDQSSSLMEHDDDDGGERRGGSNHGRGLETLVIE